MSRDGRRRRALTAAAVALPLVAATLAAVGSAQATDRRTVIGTKPDWAHSSVDRGKTSDGQRIDAKVWLSGRDPQGMDAYAAAVSTPGTPEFGKYLTPQQFNQRFGATSQQVASVMSWLSAAGLTVDRAGSTSHYVHVTGDLGDAAKAFGTDFHNYTAEGSVYRAPTHDATVPDSVGSTVLTVTGLDNAKHIRHHDAELPPPEPNFNVAEPCAAYYGQKIATKQPTAYGKHQPVAMCGLLPQQLRGAYGATASGLTGKGVTVAITDAYAAPRMEEMANQFSTKHGDKAFAPGQYREVLPADFDLIDECGAAGWYTEEALDVTAVHAMAPKANVIYAGARDCADGLDEAMLNIVDNHLADIVTNSWGELSQDVTPPLIKTEEAIFKQGAIEGIGFYFSSGDCGYDVPSTPCGAGGGSTMRQTDMPTSDPWVTAVGGTSLAVNRDNSYRFETGWNFLNDNLSADGHTWNQAPPGTYPGAYAGGAGGGTSELFGQPSYQRGVVPDSLSKRLPDGTMSKKAMREVPDIAAVADSTTGIRYAQFAQLPDGTFGYAESRVGGTSLASPVVAGLQALAQQAQGFPIGFANPAIYARANKGLYHDVTDHPLGGDPVAFVRTDFTDPSTAALPLVFHLRTTGNFGIPAGDALPAIRGYDDITGVGTPTSRYLLSYRR
jgi:subtilase family serine protease